MTTIFSNNSSQPLEWSMPLVLVTDDDESYRATVYEILREAGYRVVQAGTMQECLSAYLRYSPDLVLLSLEMPEGDSLQCLQRLRSLAGDALSPVLVMAALTQPEVMEQTFTAGATDYVSKPLKWPLLKQRMQQALQSKTAIAALELQLRQARATSVALETQLQEQTAKHGEFYQVAQAEIERLEQLNQLKDSLLNQVSHELRSPLTNMSIAIELLEQQFHLILSQKETALFLRVNLEKLLTYLTILRKQCKREIQLINNLLDLQLLDAGKHPLTVESINLTSWLSTVIEPFWHRTRERQQHLQLLANANLPAIQTDPIVLERILHELLTNASKYTPPQAKINLTVQEVVIPPSKSGLGSAYSVIQFCVSNT